MSARFQGVEVSLGEARVARVRFRLENASAGAWGDGTPLFLGWQLFDPETGLFIREGEWQPVGEVAPGASIEREVRVELPRERGRYHVYISALEESSGWHYRRGLPFLLLDATVASERAELAGARVTSLAAMRWSGRLRAFGKAFAQPAQAMWSNRSLIRSMVHRDIAARYRGSLGDALWTVLSPLLLMATYFFVFGIVLRARFGGSDSRTEFALYFLAGMLPWLPFSEALARAPAVVLEHRNFVKKLVFPIEILPINLTLAGLVTQAFALGVFLVFLLASRGYVPVSALWLPVLVIPQLLLTAGAAWILAALGVYVRDLGQVMGYLLTLWFFLTPICYPEASLPEAALPVLQANPMFVLVRGFRDVLLDGSAPAFGPLWRVWLAAFSVAILGHAWFRRLRRSFPDVI